jgi:hypothetical protein
VPLPPPPATLVKVGTAVPGGEAEGVGEPPPPGEPLLGGEREALRLARPLALAVALTVCGL